MNLNRLTLVLLLVAVALRSELFFVLLYIVVGLQLLTRLWLRYESNNLSFRREAPVAAFPGEQVTVDIELTNQGILPIPWVALHESLPPALHTPPMIREVVSLAPRERRVVRYTLSGRRRGYYQLGPLSLQTGDVLGLGERPLASEQQSSLTIYPTVVSLAELGLPANLPYGTLPATQRLFDDPARPAGVRSYQPGDGVRRIDWKSTARMQQAVVRRNQPAIMLETMVALAFSRQEFGGRFAYDQMERSLTAAASILAHLEQQRQAYGVCSSGHDPLNGKVAQLIPIGHGRGHLMAALGLLGRLEAAEHGDLLADLQRAAIGLGWGSTLVIIAAQPTTELLAATLPLQRRGLHIALILAEARPADLLLARQHGLNAYRLGYDSRPVDG
ncbi:MAG: DUF58 domain-containing protein [Roseiflexaceae bacterium]